MKSTLIFLLVFIFSTPVNAGEADVLDVEFKKQNNTYIFSVTVLHQDSGWDHYSNKWEVATEDGKILATRVLAHPHEHEQPFTRSLSGITIPDNINTVIISAFDSQHQSGGKTIKINLRKKQ